MVKTDVIARLQAAGFSAYLRGFSAADSFLGREAGASLQIFTSADTADLARLFENLRFPGTELADAALLEESALREEFALQAGRKAYYFFCADSEKPPVRTQQGSLFPAESRAPSFGILDFYQDLATGSFLDRGGAYPLLAALRRGERLSLAEILGGARGGAGDGGHLADAALILARYLPFGTETQRQGVKAAAMFAAKGGGRGPGTEEQRLLLCGLLASPNPGLGFELLKNTGFLRRVWPDLADMDDVEHTKEFHPEGNVFSHTMETFRHRKAAAGGSYDLTLSLGLLLHDLGKTAAGSAGRLRFDGHAELGAAKARRFLERLGFPAPLASDVCYLIKNHMIPAALPRLPLYRTREIMASPLFPLLMELYRCDESSSFKGLGGYYESSAVYQSYLKNSRNPYRSADGKKRQQGRGGRL
ncbi:MAG: HD domain-containing protein [Spirochaetes bacterium]|nr:HD domain-containing protein [Spirochaetota bacterium]